MNTRIIRLAPAFLVLFVISFRYFSQWCITAEQACFRTWLDRIYLYVTNPVFYFAVFFLPIAVILAIVSREMFKSWLKFAVWAIPLTFVFIALTPDSNPGAYIDFYPFYRDDAARLAGGLFAALSALLILWKYIALRRKSGQV